MNNFMIKCASVLLFAASCATVQASIIHDEAIDGDLSGAFAAPDFLPFSLGVNTVIAQVGNNGNTGATDGSDADYFRFTIAAGQQLDSIFVDSYTFSPGDPGVSFLGYVAGTAFAGQTGGDIDGLSFFNAGSGEILPELTGGGGPLGPGDYSFWVQETSDNVVDFSLSFNVIPEPASLSLLGIATLCLAWRRRR